MIVSCTGTDEAVCNGIAEDIVSLMSFVHRLGTNVPDDELLAAEPERLPFPNWRNESFRLIWKQFGAVMYLAMAPPENHEALAAYYAENLTVLGYQATLVEVANRGDEVIKDFEL